MTTNQILIGVGLILVLAVGSQVLASRLRIPALIVLLPVGFVAGALTSDVNPERLLGPAFGRHPLGVTATPGPSHPQRTMRRWTAPAMVSL